MVVSSSPYEHMIGKPNVKYVIFNVQCSDVQCSDEQCSDVQCSDEQYSDVQCSDEQYSDVQCSDV